MCKKILLLSLLLLNVYANNLDEKSTLEETFSSSSTSVLTSNDYILALSQYKLGNYTTSYNQFKKLFLQYSDNVEINYYCDVA